MLVESEENFTYVIFVCLFACLVFVFVFPSPKSRRVAAGCLPIVSNPPEFISSTTRQN